MHLLDCQQEAPVNTVLPQPPQSFLWGTRPYTFPMPTKHVYTLLECSQDFSKIWWRVKIWSVILWPRRKPHWVSSTFGSIIILAASWHSLFLGDLTKRCRGSWFIHSSLPFCVWGWSICQSFGALAKCHATWHTRVSQTIRRSKFP